jgi:tetratricopeptide (TPR) repeat protein
MSKSNYWVFSTLFCVGVIAGLSFLLISSGVGHRSASDSASEIDSSRRPSPTRPLDEMSMQADISDQQISRLRDEGNGYLMAGNFNAAAARFRRIQQREGKFSSDIVLRLALCTELRGNPTAAADLYERVIGLNPSMRHRLLAVSGLTRCWSKGSNQSEALRTLSGLLLDSLDGDRLPEEIRAQVTYQLGSVYLNQALSNYHFDLSLPSGVAFQAAEPSVSKLIEMLDAPELETEPPQDVPQLVDAPLFEVLQRPTHSIELVVVNARSPVKSLAEITRQLTAVCDLELLASPQAQIIVQSRTQSLSVKNASASLILDTLLLPLNLYWKQDGDQIHIQSFAELNSADAEQKIWAKAAERTFRRFNLAFPGDPRHQSALLSRANLNFIANDLESAANRYQELLNTAPRDELLARLFLNLGKLRMRFGQNAEAIQLFFQTVDQSYDPRLQSTSYWLAAQLSLEVGHVEEAIKTAGRALSTARTTDQKRQAAMTKARAYLLGRQPKAANQVLFDYRLAFRGSELESSASVLGCYARLVGSQEANSIKAERHRLLTALTTTRKQEYVNFLDIYIAARAFDELGFQSKTIELLTLAIESTTINEWRRRFLFELAIQEKVAGRLEEASSFLEFLISDQVDDLWRQQAMLHLTEIYATEGMAEKCIKLGERLLAADLNDSEKFTTLTSMGRAYRRLGEDHAAALCFLGMLPMSETGTIQ